ncbi:energy-coupling factor ABC transporter permease [Thiorhodovibrio frisius]|uniref:ABC-type Co2+ transport system, permease component n=1 Tax=Thiorhodovibrio frisius TaxID=631362 RepID=H8Z8I0_9GAMM|nr:energy-coupling factor ABC transporter permease [Thiorhodovibrio frisius]EIC19385.1 ABC-type Co2+ transport system, permease component [Thiorhodovibrio frisius]WPL22315.1 Energy-coupling factor transporter probable substrate-capture protein NikMN [Thiorhodovibrio frisius]
MHIPDGFLSPQTYLPAYALAVGGWVYAARELRRRVDETLLPRLAVLTALAFVLMTVMLPLPGGTSVHASGIGILAVVFGPWLTFAVVSLVLLLQALVLGAGGVTVLPVNALAMGLGGSVAACLGYRLLAPRWERAGLFAAGWLAAVVPAALVAVVLGLQPVIAHTSDGQPLFFPFGLSVTLPAVLIPHAILGLGEGLLTVLVVSFLRRR